MQIDSTFFFANGLNAIETDRSTISEHARAQSDFEMLSMSWGPFLESPENFSGPKSHS